MWVNSWTCVVANRHATTPVSLNTAHNLLLISHPAESRRLSDYACLVSHTECVRYVVLMVSCLYREEESAGHFRKDFHIFFVPRKSLLCEKKLKVGGKTFCFLICLFCEICGKFNW